MNETVYFNGSLIPRSQARIPALDYGFLYGFGIFETMRAYGGRVFRLDSHLSRLSHAADILGIPVRAMELKGAVMDTLQANKLDDARIRITVSGGEGEVIPNPDTCQKPTVLITATPYHPYPEVVYQRGFRAITDEALCLNEKGLLAEASMSNIFVVTNGTLRTPGEESGILAGITRGTVLKLASQMDIDTIEHDIKTNELFQAEEAFLTNSLMEIMPLTEIKGKPIGSGRPGAITKRLTAAYREMVERGE